MLKEETVEVRYQVNVQYVLWHMLVYMILEIRFPEYIFIYLIPVYGLTVTFANINVL